MARSISSRAAWTAALAGALCAHAAVAEGSAAPMPVPTAAQASLFKKIFGYDRALQGKPWLRVMVVGDGASEVAAAFNLAGLPSKAVDSQGLDARLGDGVVVYSLPGAARDSVKAACERKRALSISGVPSLVEEGGVSIGLGLTADGRTQIIVNLRRSKTEGHELSTDLLRLARIID